MTFSANAAIGKYKTNHKIVDGTNKMRGKLMYSDANKEISAADKRVIRRLERAAV